MPWMYVQEVCTEHVNKVSFKNTSLNLPKVPFKCSIMLCLLVWMVIFEQLNETPLFYYHVILTLGVWYSDSSSNDDLKLIQIGIKKRFNKNEHEFGFGMQN